jgi:hypothetical protein
MGGTFTLQLCILLQVLPILSAFVAFFLVITGLHVIVRAVVGYFGNLKFLAT